MCKSVSHVQNFTKCSKLWNWLKLWNVVEIVKFGWNCDVLSKLWYLVEIVKFGQNCETGIRAGVVWEGLVDLKNSFWINWKWILTFCLTDNLSEAKIHGEKVTKTILTKCLSDKMSNKKLWHNVCLTGWHKVLKRSSEAAQKS